jgi:hypothetical protein
LKVVLGGVIESSLKSFPYQSVSAHRHTVSLQISSMETLSWKNGCALPAGSFSGLVLKVPGRPIADRGHANENGADGGRRRSCVQIRTTGKTNDTPRVRGVLGILTTGASIARRIPSTASAIRLSSEPAGTLKESLMLQRWTRQSLLAP